MIGKETMISYLTSMAETYMMYLIWLVSTALRTPQGEEILHETCYGFWDCNSLSWRLKCKITYLRVRQRL